MPPTPTRQGQSWTAEEDRKLYGLTVAGTSVSNISDQHQRTHGSIRARQIRLGLRDPRSSELIQPPPPFNPLTKNNKRPVETHQTAKITRVSDDVPTTANPQRTEWNPPHAVSDPDIDWIDDIWDALEKDIKDIFAKQAHENSDRSAHILTARLSPGDDYCELATLQDLGNTYGVSRERIRQVYIKGERLLKTRIRGRAGWTYLVLCQFQSTYRELETTQLFKKLVQTLVDADVSKEFGQFIILALGRITSLTAREISRYEAAFSEVSALRETQARSAEAIARKARKKHRRADAFVSSILRKTTFSGTFAVQGVRLLAMPRLRSCNRERSLYSETLGRVVQWESYGERRFIQALDQSSIVSEFAEQPIEIDFTYQGRPRKYFVDLLVKTVDDLTVAIEIKSPVMLADVYVQAKAQAASLAFGERGIGYCLVDVHGRSTEDIRKIAVSEELKTFLRSTLRLKKRVTMRDLYSHLGHWPPAEIIDQIQSLVLEFGLDYRVRLLPSKRTGNLGLGYTFTLTTGRNRRSD